MAMWRRCRSMCDAVACAWNPKAASEAEAYGHVAHTCTCIAPVNIRPHHHPNRLYILYSLSLSLICSSFNSSLLFFSLFLFEYDQMGCLSFIKIVRIHRSAVCVRVCVVALSWHFRRRVAGVRSLSCPSTGI
jgi:hypothetical protein